MHPLRDNPALKRVSNDTLHCCQGKIVITNGCKYLEAHWSSMGLNAELGLRFDSQSHSVDLCWVFGSYYGLQKFFRTSSPAHGLVQMLNVLGRWSWASCMLSAGKYIVSLGYTTPLQTLSIDAGRPCSKKSSSHILAPRG